ncbi:MAG: DNA polymerase III subunit delta [Spirochaetaceae bacterium]|nr:MAG: DNA polymerase III subunit delta [Spirochaetaceae bacterium]
MAMAAIHLLMGPDEGNKREHLKGIAANIARQIGQEAEKTVMYSSDQGIGEAISLLRTGSLFNPHRLVIYHGADSIKKVEDQTLLAQYAVNPSGEGTLVLLSTETRVPKKIEAAVPKSQTKVFWEMFANQKEQFVIRRIAGNGRKLDRDAVQLLLESVEGTSDQLAMACDQLATLFPQGHVISEQDIDTFLFHSRQETVFSLFHAMCQRNLEQSLEIVRTLLDLQDVKPFLIITGIAWQLRRLLSIKERLQRGLKPENVWDELRIKGQRNREQLLTAARNFSLSELQARVRLITRVDSSLRSDRSSIHNHLVLVFLYRFIARN